jgi:predicted negative regulator of RcsB-dependent stress response
MVFLLLLGVVLAAVGFVGWRAYEDAQHEFKAVGNAKVWAQWLSEAGLHGETNFHPQACALAAAKDEQPPLAILLEGSGRELLLQHRVRPRR